MGFVTVLFSIFITVVNQSPPELCRRAAEANQKGNLVEAETLLKECLTKNPGKITPYLWLCALYQSQKRESDLHGIALKGLERFPEEKRFYLTAGIHAGRSGHCAESVEILSDAFRRWPTDAVLSDNLVEALLCRGMDLLDDGDNENAAADFERLLTIDSNNTVAILNLGRAYHNLQRSGEALQEFERVYGLAPDTPRIQFHRAVALSGLGRFEEAIAALNDELRSAPDHAESYYFRGVAHFYEGSWESSFADLKKAVAGMPEFSDAVYRLGRCYDHFGMNEKAEATLRTSALLDPSDVRPLYALGRLLSRSGREDEAQEMFKKAVDQYTADNIDSGTKAMKFHSTRNQGLE